MTTEEMYNAARFVALRMGRTEDEAHEDGLYFARQMQAAAGSGVTPLSNAGVEALREVLPSTLAPLQAEASSPEDAAYSDAGAGTPVVIPLAPSSPSPAPVFPTVSTPSEIGYLGHLAQLRKYGPRQLDAWRRMGGRRRNRTLAEIEASTAGNRVKATRRR